MQRLYPNLLRGVTEILSEIFDNDRYADKAIQYLFKKNKKWGARDRHFVADTVYGMVRYYRLLETLLGHSPQNQRDWYRMFGIYHIIRGGALPDWDEFRQLDAGRILKAFRQIQDPKILESVPDWLFQTGQDRLGDRWLTVLHALNTQAPVVLRANTLKTKPADLQKILASSGIETEITGRTALVLKKRANVFGLESFKKGLFEVQDAASQAVSEFVAPAPGMRVVDACAGAGGKSLHLAALMQNKGQIIATDVLEHKLQELKKRARRAGAHNIQTKPIAKAAVYKRLYGSADRVLIDAPCSGLGVLRRNPDAKWKLSPDFVRRIQQTQRDILDKYSPITKEGGMLIYATCSILPSENQEQINAFLERNDQFEFVEEKVLLPDDFGFDGFYMAKLRRIK